jgi:hypothetical protein
MTVAAPDLHLSTHDNEELVAAIALLEDRLAFRKIAGRNSRTQEVMETAFCFRHWPFLCVAPDAHLLPPIPMQSHNPNKFFGISPRQSSLPIR